MIFDVILFLIGKQVHSWIWYILKSLFGRNLFFRSLSILVDARTSFLFLYHYIEHAFAFSTTIMYLLLSPPQFMFMDTRLTASDCLCSVVEFMIALPISNVNYLFSIFFTYLTFISKYRTILLLNKRWWFFGNRKIRYNR